MVFAFSTEVVAHMDMSNHWLKTSPTEGTCKVLASISLVTFSIKMMGKLKLPYPLLFINIHKGIKYPISVHQNLQSANINGCTVRCFREHVENKEMKNCENIYGNAHISKVRHYETTLQLIRASRSKKYSLLLGENVHLQNKWAGKTELNRPVE